MIDLITLFGRISITLGLVAGAVIFLVREFRKARRRDQAIDKLTGRRKP